MLTAGDMALLRALSASARIGDPCPTVDEMADFMGVAAVSTPVASLTRLEQASLIRVRRFQKHRVITICATGYSTAEPDNPKPHWRDRPMGMAAGALKLAEIAQPGASERIRELSEQRGKAVPDMIGEIMRRGLRSIQREVAKG